MSPDLEGMNPPFPDFNPSRVHELDVRDILAGGGEPFPTIIGAADRLQPGWVLHLRTPFQPVPLYAVMAERGFHHYSTMFAGDDWSTWFWRVGDEDGAVRLGEAPAIPAPSPAPGGSWDLRHLPPPEPLVAILERVQDAAEAFRVVLPWAPAPLAALLDGQGWEVRADQVLADGSVVVVVAPR